MTNPISPDHYQFGQVQVIDLTENLTFNRGNVVKYVARAGVKDAATEMEDLKKAAWYLTREIKRLENA